MTGCAGGLAGGDSEDERENGSSEAQKRCPPFTSTTVDG